MYEAVGSSLSTDKRKTVIDVTGSDVLGCLGEWPSDLFRAVLLALEFGSEHDYSDGDPSFSPRFFFFP